MPLLVLAAFAPGQEPTDAPDRTPSDFVRFVREGDGGHLDTAITTYRKDDVELILFGAVHIADAACYQALNDRFAACEVLLYELVAPEDSRPTKNRDEGFNPLSMLQHGLKTSMELAFQLDVIDYQAPNFVHADMTPAEFEQSMAERGETLLSLMLNMMMAGMEMQQDMIDSGKAAEFAGIDLVKAFRSGEGRHTLRIAFASQLEELEKLAAGGGKEGGSTLLEGRNEKCLHVLQREMAAGRNKIGIYYGAAHLPHMERRLVGDLGFCKVGHEWLVAWDCKKRPDKKYDRALVKQRQRARGELEALARIARDFRRETKAKAKAKEPVTVRELAAADRGGSPWYVGPVADPWGRDYVVRKRTSGVRWEVLSVGPDGAAGTDDDLVEQEPRAGGLFGR